MDGSFGSKPIPAELELAVRTAATFIAVRTQVRQWATQNGYRLCTTAARDSAIEVAYNDSEGRQQVLVSVPLPLATKFQQEYELDNGVW